MNKSYNLKLDLQFRCNNSIMTFSEFDNNTSDFFMRITNGGKLVDIEKAIVVLATIKPSGKVSSQFVEVENGLVYADLKPSMKDEVGIYTARAMLILEDERVVTDTINYEVKEDKIFSLLNDSVEATEEYSLLTDMLNRLSTIEISEEQRMINEAERILSEENRKIEEAKRVEAELIRQHEEVDRTKYDATRESNENIRKQNESIRLANETNRIDEEAKRVEEENKRKLAEEERNANYNFMTEDEERRRSEANAHKEAEVLRVQAETNRVNEEAKRRTTEQARVSAENTRVNNENTRETNEVVRKNNENQRIEAETQRQNRYNSFILEAEANANNFENYTNTAKVKEEERKANELDRKSQEDRRVSNEVERISNENTRKANENARIESEKQRVDAENLRKEKIIEIQTDYDSLKKVIIDENVSANLQNQINQTNSQLEHKASKKHVWNMANMGQDIKEAMTGGSVAVVGENTVLTENIVDNQVTYEKLSDDFSELFTEYNKTVNLYDKSKAQRNKFSFGGNVIVNTDRIYNGYILSVISGTTYTISVQCEDSSIVLDGIQFWKDSTYVRVSYASGNGKTYTFTANDSYDGVTFNIKTNTGHTLDDYNNILNKVQFEVGSTATDVVAFSKSYKLKNDYFEGKDILNDIEKVNDLFIETSSTKNLFNSELAERNKLFFVDKVVVQADSIYSSKIKVFGGDTVTISIQNLDGIIFDMVQIWKNDGTFQNLSCSSKLHTLILPKNATHISFNIKTNTGHTLEDYNNILRNVQVEVGSTATDVVAYEKKLVLETDKWEYANKIMTKGKYYNKNVYTFGDSITQGMTYGSWVPYMASILECNTTNKAVSGHSSMSLVAVMTDITRWGGNTTESIDYSNIDAITIQIGTNSFMRGEITSIPYGFGKQLKDMPFEHNGTTISTYDEYFANFPNNYFGHVGACIEWVKWKNPNCKIYLITEPHNMSEYHNGTGVWKYIYEVRDYMIQLGKFYSVPVIDAVYEAGLTDRNFADYSYDLCHLNTLGNKMWGEYIAYQMLSR